MTDADVSITHLAFGREFTRAIEAKQVAQQESERAKFVVAKAEQLKQAAIIRAEGESEAAVLISQALAVNGTGLIEVRRIDVRSRLATMPTCDCVCLRLVCLCTAEPDLVRAVAVCHPCRLRATSHKRWHAPAT